MKTVRSRIIGTGYFVPEKILTNHDLEKMVETSHEWIVERTGIYERRIAGADEATSDLAVKASREALRNARIKTEDLDFIIVATVTPDMLFPATACLIQERLGAYSAFAFDISAACSGFVYALSVADQYIRSGLYRSGLVIGADVFSKIIDWEDRNTCVLFGDGAGAVVIQADHGDRGVISTHICSDGTLWDLLYVPGGGSRTPPGKEMVEARLQYVRMRGNETFKVAVNTLSESIRDILKHNGLTPEDITLFIPHQANLRIIQAVARRLNVPIEKFKINLNLYGNTSAASIPIALHEALCEGNIADGDYVLLTAFGGGLTWGSAVIKW